jgi:hypothetical protein
MSKLIRADEVTTKDVIIIAGFEYPVTNVGRTPYGSVVLTIDTGYTEPLSAHDMVRVKDDARQTAIENMYGRYSATDEACQLHERLAREAHNRGDIASAVWHSARSTRLARRALWQYQGWRRLARLTLASH